MGSGSRFRTTKSRAKIWPYLEHLLFQPGQAGNGTDVGKWWVGSKWPPTTALLRPTRGSACWLTHIFYFVPL